jgi:DNA-binding CsgD family transcriptional regulator
MSASPPLDTIRPVLTGRIGLSPTMIGRGAALDQLVAAIDDVVDPPTGPSAAPASDLPTVVLVVGEPGIGKTRLVREALTAAAPPVVLNVAAEPGSMARPLDLVDQLAAQIGDVPDGQRSVRGDRDDRVADALAVIDRAAVGGAVLVVEDLHWIDADSAQFVDEVARSARPGLAIVATYRAADLRRGAPGGELVARLERRNEVQHVRLDRLDRSDVGTMMAAIVEGPVSSSAVEAVTRRSGGVPFVVEELMRGVDADACSADVFDVELPWSLDDAVRQQLDRVGAAERAVVDALAVLGRPATYELLADVVGVDDDALVERLGALNESGVILESRDGRFWFSHALVADTVAQQLLGRVRRRLHERCLDAISVREPDDLAGLAEHARGAGSYDAIADFARRGARRYLDRGSSFQALRLAVEGLDEEPDDVELLRVATEAAWRLDFVHEALDHALAWRRLAQAGTDELDLVDAMRLVGRLHLELGDVDEAHAVERDLTAASERWSAAGSLASAARALGAVAQLAMLEHRPEAYDLATTARELAVRAGDRWAEVQASVERASAMLHHTDRATSLAALRAAAAAADEIGDRVLVSRALNNMVELLAPMSPEAADCRARLRSVAASIGFDKLGSRTVVWWEAGVAYADGDLAAYRRLLESWVTTSGLFGHRRKWMSETALLAVEDGRLADAHGVLTQLRDAETPRRRDRAGDPTADTGDGVVDRPRSLGVAVVELGLAALESDAATAAEALAGLGALSSDLPDAWEASSIVLDAVMLALAAGVTPAVARDVLARPPLADHVSAGRFVELCEGPLAAAEGRHHDAIAAMEPLVDVDDLLARHHRGSLSLCLAQSLLHVGRRTDAAERARAARADLERWPGWRRDRVDAFLARVEGSSLRPLGELTAREFEVAALVAEGLTNGQLAERLYISPKTAAVHVSNILAKLQLSSRAEIAAWEVRRQLPVAGS